MTKLSLVPEIAAYKGISFLKLIEWILIDANKKSRRVLIYFFLLILLGSINNINFNKINFNQVKNIKITGLDFSESKIFQKNSNLNLENFFSLNSDQIKNN